MRGARKRAGWGAGRRERGWVAVAAGKCSFSFRVYRGAEIPGYLRVVDPHALRPPGLSYGSVRPVSTDDRLSFLRPVSRGFKRGLGRKGGPGTLAASVSVFWELAPPFQSSPHARPTCFQKPAPRIRQPLGPGGRSPDHVLPSLPLRLPLLFREPGFPGLPTSRLEFNSETRNWRRELGPRWHLTKSLGPLIPREEWQWPSTDWGPTQAAQKEGDYTNRCKEPLNNIWEPVYKAGTGCEVRRNQFQPSGVIRKRCHLNIGLCLFSTDPVGEDILDHYPIWTCSCSTSVTSPGNTVQLESCRWLFSSRHPL